MTEVIKPISLADLDNEDFNPVIDNLPAGVTGVDGQGGSGDNSGAPGEPGPAGITGTNGITGSTGSTGADPIIQPKELEFSNIKEFFEKKYGTKVESEDALKSIFDSASKMTDYEKTQKELSNLKEQYEILLTQADPLSLFSSEDAYKLEQFRKAFPDKDPLIATQIFSAKDLKTVSDYDIVKWGYKIDFPGMKGDEDDLRSTIAEDLRIDPALDVKEWPVPAQNRLNKMATEFRNKFEEMKKIEGPKRVDVTTIRQQRQTELENLNKSLEEGWSKAAPVISKDSQTLKIQVNEPKDGEQPEFFEWDLGDAPKAKLDSLVKGMVALGTQPSEATIAGMKEAVQQSLFWENKDKIIHAIRKDFESRLEQKHIQETHNPDPLKGTERDAAGADKQKQELSAYVSEGNGKFKGRKLF
jgi:hypothetical protein